MSTPDPRYLALLAERYPTAHAARAEQARLLAQATLPAGTELFLSDIHGEYETFSHIVRGASGAIRALIDELFADEPEEVRAGLAALILYPEEHLPLALAQQDDVDAWLTETLQNLGMVVICSSAAVPHSELAAMIPEAGSVVTDMVVPSPVYVANAVSMLVETGAAEQAIIDLCHLVQRLYVAKLHLVGDIYDRGPRPDSIVEELMGMGNVDIQWGNHDIVWMGAALGQRGCIAHVVRNCARYGNLDILTDGYGINLLPLVQFAQEAYCDDPCVAFGLKSNPGLSEAELEMNVKVQKAMAILQFKVEAQLIDENPSFGLESRKLLHRIDWDKNTVEVDGIEWPLADTVFPTVDPSDPYALTPEEEACMQALEDAFRASEKLQRHMRFLLEAGSLYKIANGNLLLHACVPLNADGSLLEVELFGETYKGRALYDVLERLVREGFDAVDAEARKRGRDIMWYLWLGAGSPLFAKSKMATFEIYLIADKAARKEEKNAFYKLFDQTAPYEGIFEDFGLDPQTAHIVCGHVPVKVKDGEDPVRAGGKVICIDGGMAAAYRKTSGIAGFTLVNSAENLALYAHEPLESRAAAIAGTADIVSHVREVESYAPQRRAAETDEGRELVQRAADLDDLLEAYATGAVSEAAR